MNKPLTSDAPAPTLIWSDICVQGGRVSRDWMHTAWQEVERCGDPGALESHLMALGPVPGRDAPIEEGWSAYHYAQEIANRMRQKARKAKVIAFTGKPRKWRFV